MTKCKLMLAAALALLMTSGAIAAEITDKTRCSEFVAASNVYDKATNAGNKLFKETEEGQKLQEYYLFMGNTMDGLDIDPGWKTGNYGLVV
jgi:hypothetical protein